MQIEFGIQLFVLSGVFYVSASIVWLLSLLSLRLKKTKLKSLKAAIIVFTGLNFLGGLSCFGSLFMQIWLGEQGALVQHRDHPFKTLPLAFILGAVLLIILPVSAYLRYKWEMTRLTNNAKKS